jgi:hypothetical protein
MVVVTPDFNSSSDDPRKKKKITARRREKRQNMDHIHAADVNSAVRAESS